MVRCGCGAEYTVRVASLLYDHVRMCRSCAGRTRAESDPEKWRELALKGLEAANKVPKLAPYSSLSERFGKSDVQCVRQTMVGAKGRCNRGHPDYGARGIQFLFPDILAATTWVLENLGPRPSAQHSIDRIDNDAHYEPGNLRWATRKEQARNKRAYKRSTQGEFIRRVQAIRPDLNYETIRGWIAQGMDYETIIRRRKYDRSSL